MKWLIVLGNGKVCNYCNSLVESKTQRLSSMSLKAYLLVALSFGHVSVLVLLLSYFIFVKNYLSLCRYYLHPAHRRYFVIVFNSLWSILRWMFDFLILVAWYRCSIEFTKLNTIPEFHTVCQHCRKLCHSSELQ